MISRRESSSSCHGRTATLQMTQVMSFSSFCCKSCCVASSESPVPKLIVMSTLSCKKHIRRPLSDVQCRLAGIPRHCQSIDASSDGRQVLVWLAAIWPACDLILHLPIRLLPCIVLRTFLLKICDMHSYPFSNPQSTCRGGRDRVGGGGG